MDEKAGILPDESVATALRVIALHDLGYCERLFYLTEVEGLQAPHPLIYAGRELHASLEAEEDGERTQLDLDDPALGLMGKVDAVRRRDGSLIPYEHKRGRCRRGADNAAMAWPSDRLQILGYTALIEATTDQKVVEGRIRYHADNVTVRVPFDETGRRELAEAIARARTLRAANERPPVVENERLCVRCSLAPVCLPEEVRYSEDPDHAPVRLFPPDRDGTHLHVMTPGARVGRAAETITVTLPDGGVVSKHPINQLDGVIIHGYGQLSTQAINLCVDREVPVHWLSTTGRHVASLTATAGQVQRRVRQYRALSDEATRLRLARALVRGKVESQSRYLLRATRGDPSAREAIEPNLMPIRQSLAAIGEAPTADALRGYEGAAACAYFPALNAALSPNVAESLRYATRTRRPPRDRFNALLSYGYGLLHAATMRAVLASGLEPSLGFFHTPRSAAYPLVLDLMELYRVILWDMVVIAALNRGQIDPEADFAVTPAKVWLSDSGRRKAIDLFEARLDESWRHPVMGYSLSYARTLELEARLLEKEWTGEPGLFARVRLR